MQKQNLEKEQEALAKQVILTDLEKSYIPKHQDLVLTLDIQYQNEDAFVAGHLAKWQDEDLGIFLLKSKVKTEYESGYFCFREGPILLDFIQKLDTQKDLKPDLVIVDGHGIAHPRGLGVASWLGVKTHLPTIGCAKRTLLPFENNLGGNRRDFSAINFQEKLVGYALRTQNQIKPIFVSVGHLIHLDIARNIILELSPNYRLPEPLRQADQKARLFAKGDFEGNRLLE